MSVPMVGVNRLRAGRPRVFRVTEQEAAASPGLLNGFVEEDTVAVIMITDLPGMGTEMVDGMRQAGLFDRMKSAPGFRGHWSGAAESGYRVIELWESRDAWQEWFDGTITSSLPPGIEATEPAFIDLAVEVRPT